MSPCRYWWVREKRSTTWAAPLPGPAYTGRWSPRKPGAAAGPAAAAPPRCAASRVGTRRRAAPTPSLRQAGAEGAGTGRAGGAGGREAAGARGGQEPSQSQARARGRAPTPAMAPSYVRGPRICAARRDRDRGCPAAAWRRPPASGATDPSTAVLRLESAARDHSTNAEPGSPSGGRTNTSGSEEAPRHFVSSMQAPSWEWPCRHLKSGPAAALSVTLSPSRERPCRHVGSVSAAILRVALPPCWGPGHAVAAHAHTPPAERGNGSAVRGRTGAGWSGRVESHRPSLPRSHRSRLSVPAGPAALPPCSDTGRALVRWTKMSPKNVC